MWLWAGVVNEGMRGEKQGKHPPRVEEWGDIVVRPHCSFPTTPFSGWRQAQKGPTLPRVTQHKEGALPCALLIMGQIWCHVSLLGGSLAFLGTKVEWDLVLPGLNSHERKPVPVLGLTIVGRSSN